MADDATAVAAAKAEGLPCWAELGEVTLAATSDEAVSAELELGSGRTNQNFIATRKDGAKRYFVRIGQDIPAYGVTRAKEQAAGRAAADAGIAPQVLYTAPDAMVTEFSDGRTLTDAQLRRRARPGPTTSCWSRWWRRCASCTRRPRRRSSRPLRAVARAPSRGPAAGRPATVSVCPRSSKSARRAAAASAPAALPRIPRTALS